MNQFLGLERQQLECRGKELQFHEGELPWVVAPRVGRCQLSCSLLVAKLLLGEYKAKVMAFVLLVEFARSLVECKAKVSEFPALDGPLVSQ